MAKRAKGAGRPRVPVEKLKLYGRYRADRHGDRGTLPKVPGEPAMPDDMSEWAVVHWECVVPDLVKMGIVTPVDSIALASMCEWWAVWKGLLSGEIKTRNLVASMAHASGHWLKFASRFGMTPSDRAGLPAPDKKDVDSAARFIG